MGEVILMPVFTWLEDGRAVTCSRNLATRGWSHPSVDNKGRAAT